MYITLKENVYLVKGKVKGCIYDFNTGNMYQLDKNVVNLLDNVINKKEEEITAIDEREIVREFTENELMQYSEQICENDIKQLTDKPSSIEFAWIEVTTKCNLYCIHCYDSSSPHEAELMNFDQFEKVHKFIVDNSIRKIQFIGGEPLILGDLLKEMIRSIRKDVDFLEVFTNATLLTDEWADFFAENKVHIAASVYSYIAEQHDKVTTVKGAHARTNAGLKKLADRKVPFRVCNVLMNGIEIGKCNTDLYTINTKKDVVRMVGRANFHLLSKELIQRRLITEQTFSVPLNRKMSEKLVNGHNCFGHKVYISATGEAFPCVMERRWSYGNIYDNYTGTIERVGHGDIPIAKDKIESCKDCEFRYACFDCRPNSLGRELSEKPWYCTYEPESGEWCDSEEYINELIEQYSVK